MKDVAKPLVLSKENCFHELSSMGTKGQLPLEVVHLVQNLILQMIKNLISDTATSRDVALAKEYLSDGIQLGDRLYDVCVYVPNDKKHGRSFFTLVRRWPNGELKRLEEV